MRDAGIIAGAQPVEHYEMAVYGSLKTWAVQLGESTAAQLLEKTLAEEKEADKKLTQIPMGSVNGLSSWRVVFSTASPSLAEEFAP